MARSRTGTRSDSVSATMAAHVAVREPRLEPPRPLPERMMPLWRAVIESRARHEWQRLDLHLAAELVRLVDDLDEQGSALRREGLMRPSRRGSGTTPNPRLEVVAQLQRRVLQLQARLCLTPKAFGFKADRVANARELERDARNLSREPPADPLAELMRMWEDDGLLART